MKKRKLSTTESSSSMCSTESSSSSSLHSGRQFKRYRCSSSDDRLSFPIEEEVDDEEDSSFSTSISSVIKTPLRSQSIDLIQASVITSSHCTVSTLTTVTTTSMTMTMTQSTCKNVIATTASSKRDIEAPRKKPLITVRKIEHLKIKRKKAKTVEKSPPESSENTMSPTPTNVDEMRTRTPTFDVRMRTPTSLPLIPLTTLENSLSRVRSFNIA